MRTIETPITWITCPACGTDVNAEFTGFHKLISCPAKAAQEQPHEPVAAPRDWNDEFKAVVARYQSVTEPGFALHCEDVDRGGYHPYSRTPNAKAVTL